MTFKITVETLLNPTEDEEKVKVALNNIVKGQAKRKTYGRNQYLIVETSNLNDIEPLYKRLREQMILETARTILLENLSDNKTVFYLNKQAAYMNNVNFCEPEGESPLGPIIVSIEGDKIKDFIDWLTPHTVNGKPVETKTLQDLLK
ncbi:MAG: RNA-binding domain-containing protein [Candidatus Odinarchaeia archaeon]